jgi:hypothetical protein
MSFKSEIDQAFKAMVESGNIVYANGDLANALASGAPGAYKQMRSNAAATAAWWVCAVMLGNLSGAGPTRVDVAVARAQDGSGTDIARSITVLLEAATATLVQNIRLPYPVKVVTGVGAAGQQNTASGKTIDAMLLYATAVGS